MLAYTLWTWVFSGVLWAVSVFGGGAFLFVGAKFIVKTPRAFYWRSVWAMFLGTLGYAAITTILSLFTNMNASLPTIGLVLGLFWTWLTIGLVLKISFKKSILAWLPVLGFQLLIGIILMIFVILPVLDRARDLAEDSCSRANLNGIATGIEIYKAKNRNVYPPSFDELLESGLIAEKMLITPPGDVSDGSRSYFYLPPKNAKDVDSETIIACEKKNLNKSRKGRNVLFVDGSVKFLSPEEFATELAKPHNATFAAALKQADGP
jgi:prepilin-type processing-associated H-X9-DG protein